MAPWVHLYTSPVGEAAACCISREVVGNTTKESVGDIMNSDKMKQLRLDMINEQFNPACAGCHAHQAQGISSSKDQFAKRFNQHFDEAMANTLEDGTLNKFKMRYFDIRFNNVCNFKCRTCNGAFSTLWEQEDIKRKLPWGTIHPKNNTPELLEEVIEHIPHMEYAYFAGGEPLITEEHYIVLEEMIKQGRTDINLVYNSNVSNLKFKSKDIVELWSHFKNPVQLEASIDHHGERAEYIRHGTDWGQVESNLIKLNALDNVKLGLNTVCSVFNYHTMLEFYHYLIEKKIYTSWGYSTFGIYNMSTPVHFTSQMMPTKLKREATFKIKTLLRFMDSKGFPPYKIPVVESTMAWANAQHTWTDQKATFQKEIAELDKVRGEDFVKVFPELASMMD
jgi:organic radical activating enzyme